MNADREAAVRHALAYVISMNRKEPQNGENGKAPILRALKLTAWPESGGFGPLAEKILFAGIAQEWPS